MDDEFHRIYKVIGLGRTLSPSELLKEEFSLVPQTLNWKSLWLSL